MEDGLGEKGLSTAGEGRELWSQRKVRERGVHKGMHKENTSPKLLAGKKREAVYVFLQSVGHEDWHFKGQ